jgi:acetolactate synthase-1/2/3 large subunit
MTAATAMVKALEREGVKHIFGYPGAAICPFLRALSDTDINTTIKFSLVRHETAAGLAANGYARVSGSVGVSAATSGPGALNLLPAIACAYADSIPIVAITGQVHTREVGSDAFQEADITGAAEPFVKYSYLIKTADDIPRIFREAFFLAAAGRPGPVLIDVPMDVQTAECSFYHPEAVNLRSYKPTIEGNIFQIKKAAEVLFSAKRPLIIAGGGIFSAKAVSLLRQFVNSNCNGIPVCTTMMGIGVMPADNPLNLGMIGMFGQKCANEALKAADTILIIGARVSDRAIPDPEKLSGCEIIHVDIDPAELGKNIQASVPVVCDVFYFLEKLLEQAKKASLSPQQPWITRELTPPVNSAEIFISKLMSRAAEGTIVTADVGNNQITSARCFNIKNGSFLTSGGMGTMGYALPAAIGAVKAAAERTVICISGDGGFQMTMAELAAVKEQHLPIKIVILNDSSLGMVRDLVKKEQWEGNTDCFGADCFGLDLSQGNPDFTALAACYGIAAETVTDFDVTAIDRLFESENAYLLNVII